MIRINFKKKKTFKSIIIIENRAKKLTIEIIEIEIQLKTKSSKITL